jgi:hypothetical protein
MASVTVTIIRRVETPTCQNVGNYITVQQR